MRPLSSDSGSDGYGETPGEAGDSSAFTPGKVFYQELIAKANTVPLNRVFKYYGLRINEASRKIVCPFPTHKGGRENSASFYYYANTNSFYCFGCKTGGEFAHGCEFMAAMDQISRAKAAYRILELFPDDVDDSADIVIDGGPNFSETLEIMMDFSNDVREFRRNHPDEKSMKFIEHVCAVYDRMNLKHKFDNEALRRITDTVKQEIKSYKACPTP